MASTNIHSLVVDALMGAAADWEDIARHLGFYQHVASQVPSHAAPIHGLRCLVTKIIAEFVSFSRLEQTLRDMGLIDDAMKLERLRNTCSPAIPPSAVIAELNVYLEARASASVFAPVPAAAFVSMPVWTAATIAPAQECGTIAPGAEAPSVTPIVSMVSPAPVAVAAPAATTTVVHSGPVRVRARTPPTDTIPSTGATQRRVCLLLAEQDRWRDVCLELGIKPVEVECRAHTGSPAREYARHLFHLIEQRCIGFTRLAAAYEAVAGSAEPMYLACDKLF